MVESILEAAARKAREKAPISAGLDVDIGTLKPKTAAQAGPVAVPATFSCTETPEQAAQRLRLQREARAAQLLRHAGIPDKFAGASIGDLNRVPAEFRARYRIVLEKLLELSRVPSAIVALIGVAPDQREGCSAYGNGKTHMSCAVVAEACRNLVTARYAVKPDYLSSLSAEFRPGGNAAAVEDAHRRPTLLVLDEIQKKGQTVWNQDQFSDLVDARYRANKTTVLIGNVNEEELAAVVGMSVYDRIFDRGALLTCDWPSLRGRLIPASD